MGRSTLPGGATSLLALAGSTAVPVDRTEVSKSLDPDQVGDSASEAKTTRPEAPRTGIAVRRIVSRRDGGGAPSKGRAATRQPAKSVTSRVKLTAEVPFDLADAVRNAVVALSPKGLTINGLLTDAIERELDRLKKLHNGSDEFPLRYTSPKTGRPIG